MDKNEGAAVAGERTSFPRFLDRLSNMGLEQREAVAFHVFAAPWIVGFLVFTLIPFVASLVLSLMHYEIITPPVWAGVGNYVKIIKDPLIRQSLKVTTLYSVGSVSLGLIVAFLAALLMNQKIAGINVWRTIYYMPSTLSGVPVALLWMWIFSPTWGLLNTALGWLGIQGPQWLFSRVWVIPSLILMSVWSMGGSMVIFLAGLQGIPQQLYESAELDGAGPWNRFRYVTIPMVSPVIFFNLVMGIIGSFRSFTNAYVMTDGGPANASLLYVLYLYRQAFNYWSMGYACAMAWVLLGVTVILTLLLFRTSSYWVYYEGGIGG